MAVIKIVSKKEGFWRMGIRHSRVAHLHLAEELGNKLPALKAEPMLDVKEVPEEQIGEEIAAGAIATFEYQPEDEGEFPEFSEMTVAELKEFAAAHDLNIGNVTKKAEIIEAIKTALQEFLPGDE